MKKSNYWLVIGSLVSIGLFLPQSSYAQELVNIGTTEQVEATNKAKAQYVIDTQKTIKQEASKELANKEAEAKETELIAHWIEVDHKLRYQYQDGTFAKDGFADINGKTYFFDAEGYCHTGWLVHQDKWYWFTEEGIMKSDGWLEIDNHTYYFYQDGHMAQSTIIDGKHVNKWGMLVVDAWQQNDIGKWYRYADGSYPKNDWAQIEEKWYYFNQAGYLVYDWQQINGEWYYFYSDGHMAANEQIGTDYVNQSGAFVPNKWVEDKKGWKYRFGNGQYAKNQFVNIYSKWYYFGEDTYMYRWKWLKDEAGHWYYFESGGEMTSGQWRWINDVCYYFYPDGHMAANEQIGTDYVNQSGAWVPNKWVEDKKGWKYRFGNGQYAKNQFVNIYSKWYYFGEDTYMYRWKWLKDEAGHWYYFESGGQMTSGQWRWINDVCYYFYPDGHMAINEQIGTDYVNQSGAWVPNKWVEDKKGWKYRFGNGTYAKNQFVKIYSNWYYFGEDSYMYRLKWLQYKKDWYYFRDGGSMQTGWRKISGRYYNFDANGKLSNGENGQAKPNKLIDLPGFYISPMIADKNNTRDERIEAMISTAMSYLGTTYRACWAGAPGTYCDCSGLVMQSLYAAGYDPAPISPKRHALPAYEYESRNFWSDSRIPTVPARERQRGDLVFYHNGYGTVIHIAIYLGDNKVIEEWPPYCMIKPVDWSIRPYVLGYKRVF